MKQILKERGQIDLDIGFFDDFLNAEELSCIDQPIAAYASLYNRKYYYLYSMYILWWKNWSYPLPNGFINSRNVILRKIGLSIENVEVKNENELLCTLKRNVDNKIATILYLHRKTLVYDQGYGDEEHDSLHGILFTGYNTKYPAVCIRDVAHIERSGAKYEGSGYGLFRLWLKESLLQEMWSISKDINFNTEWGNGIYTVVQFSEKNIITEKEILKELVNCGEELDDNKFLNCLNNIKDDLSVLKDDDTLIWMRITFLASKKAFFKILKLLYKERKLYNAICEIEEEYIRIQDDIINILAIRGKRNKILKKDEYDFVVKQLKKVDIKLRTVLTLCIGHPQ